jgi:hypothetical protein
VKLVIVELHYGGPTDETPNKSVAVKSGAKIDSPAWHLKIKDKSKLGYDWSATYYFVDGTHKQTDPLTQTDTIVVPPATV